MELLDSIKNGPPSLEPSPVTSEKKKMTIGTSLMYGAGKIVDGLANKIIGDQPELIAEIGYVCPYSLSLSSNVAGICQEAAVHVACIRREERGSAARE